MVLSFIRSVFLRPAKPEALKQARQLAEALYHDCENADRSAVTKFLELWRIQKAYGLDRDDITDGINACFEDLASFAKGSLSAELSHLKTLPNDGSISKEIRMIEKEIARFMDTWDRDQLWSYGLRVWFTYHWSRVITEALWPKPYTK